MIARPRGGGTRAGMARFRHLAHAIAVAQRRDHAGGARGVGRATHDLVPLRRRYLGGLGKAGQPRLLGDRVFRLVRIPDGQKQIRQEVRASVHGNPRERDYLRRGGIRHRVQNRAGRLARSLSVDLPGRETYSRPARSRRRVGSALLKQLRPGARSELPSKPGGYVAPIDRQVLDLAAAHGNRRAQPALEMLLQQDAVSGVPYIDSVDVDDGHRDAPR